MGGTVNLRPDSFAEGGGLIDDFDGVISDIGFIMTDYDGNSPNAVPVCDIHWDVDGEDHSEMFSVGGSDDFAPDETGKGLIKLKSKDTLTKKSKFGMFLGSLVEAGFPLNKMDDKDIGYLNGFSGHFMRKVVTYQGLAKKKDKDNTVLLCTKVIALPGEGGKAVAKGGKKVKVDAGLADELTAIIQGVLVESDGSMPKKNLLSALFKNDDVGGSDNKKGLLKLATDDTFLKGREEWKYEDGVLTMA